MATSISWKFDKNCLKIGGVVTTWCGQINQINFQLKGPDHDRQYTMIHMPCHVMTTTLESFVKTV